MMLMMPLSRYSTSQQLVTIQLIETGCSTHNPNQWCYDLLSFKVYMHAFPHVWARIGPLQATNISLLLQLNNSTKNIQTGRGIYTHTTPCSPAQVQHAYAYNDIILHNTINTIMVNTPQVVVTNMNGTNASLVTTVRSCFKACVHGSSLVY